MALLDETIEKLRGTDPPVEVDLDVGLKADVLQQIHAYWVSKCGAGTMPDRLDIDPHEMGRLLPFVSLFEVSRTADGIELFPRLAGQEMERVMGPIHLRPLDQTLAPHIVERWKNIAAIVVEIRKPIRTVGVVHHREKHYIRSEVYAAPLTHGGPDVGMILVGTVFTMSMD